MSRFFRVLPATVALLLATPAQADHHGNGETGLITANDVDVRMKPSMKAEPVIKLYVGRIVKVHAHDKGWLHIKFDVERGPDKIPMEGWLPKKYVRARSRFGFSFERRGPGVDGAVASPAADDDKKKKKKKKKKDKKDKNTTPDTPPEPAVAASNGDSADDDWGAEGESEDDWGDDAGAVAVDDSGGDFGEDGEVFGDDGDNAGSESAATKSDTEVATSEGDDFGDDEFSAGDDFGDEGEWGKDADDEEGFDGEAWTEEVEDWGDDG